MSISVETLWKEYISIKEFLEKQKEISYLNNYTRTMRKVFILSCGSYFEHAITEMLKNYVNKITQNERLKSFIISQSIKRSFFKLFKWGDETNPTGGSISEFLKSFGPIFNKVITNEINQTETIKQSQNAFLLLGTIRNIIVHKDFASYEMDDKIQIIKDKTPEDIYKLYESACEFITFIEERLNKADNVTNPTPNN